MPTRRELLTTGAAPFLRVQASKPVKSYGAEYFSNVVLTTHEGKRVKFYDDLIRGKIVAFNMMYARCKDTCPMMTANLARVQKLLDKRVGTDIFMYSITLQPHFDTAKDLRRYAESQGVGPGWLFLTGAPSDIEHVRSRLGFTDPDPRVDRNISSHTGMLRLGNDRLDRWSMSPALAAPEHILAAINHIDPSVAHTAGSGLREI